MSGAVSERLNELSKNFVSALFMGLRTARIHSESNKAFDQAVRTIHESSRALHAATGGFRLVFVGETTLLNDARLRLDPSSMAVVRSLRAALESKKLGGLVVEHPPNYESSRGLLDLLRSSGPVDETVRARAQVSLLGPQSFTDDGIRGMAKIDPEERAIRVYAKLLIGLREHFKRFGDDDEISTGDLRPLRLSRTIQDMVEVASLAPRALLVMANHDGDTWLAERHGANVCCLAIALGHTLGLDRSTLLDLGLVSSIHHMAVSPDGRGRFDEEAVRRAFFQMLVEGGAGPSAAMRISMLANHRRPVGSIDQVQAGGPDLAARVIGLCATYQQLRTGFGLRRPVRSEAVDVLALLYRDQSGRFDPDLVDLLVNMLRAFPVGVEVILASGGRGIVSSHAGARRWDRPVVVQTEPERKNLDLMARRGTVFLDTIVGTARFHGAPDLSTYAFAAEAFPTRPGPRTGRPVEETPAAAGTADLEQVEQGGLNKMSKEAEALLKDFLDAKD
ncbi:MAG: hypothetical protein AAF851_02970 [Myxococcota bacterium]